MKIVCNCVLAVKLIFQYAFRHGLLYVLVCLIPGFFGGIRVILVQKLVDRGLVLAGTGQGLEMMAVTGTLLVTVLFFWFVLERLQGYEDKLLEIRLIGSMAPDIMEKLNGIEYSAFEQKEIQMILQRIGGEPWQNVKSCFSASVCTVQALLSVFFLLGVYASLSPWIGMGIFLVAVPMVFLNFAATRRLQAVISGTTPQMRRIEDLKRLFQDRNAMYEMKIFGSQEWIAGKWDMAASGIETEISRAGRKVLALEGGSKMLNITYFVFMIVAMTYLFLQERVTVGQYAAVIGSLSTVIGQIQNASWNVTNTFRNALDMEYYREFLAIPARRDRRNVDTLSHGDIVFENVSFSYPGSDREVLKNVTFRIKAGEKVAFVGENGAGKSTIVKLLCGLYEPDAGRVMMGGVDIRDLSEEKRRKCLTVVFQDFQGYELTLRENVALGDIDGLEDDARILEALRQAGGEELYLHEKKGLEQNLGHLEADGKDLSRGQWQRVAGARAFMADAAFCILDEPTAALDPVAESRMYENFARIFRKKGTIMISHRLASAKMADRIMVLDGGRIVQNGSHGKLMETEGLYRTMYLAQSSWYN